MSSVGNKNFLVALGAGVLLVGAAVVFHMFTNKESTGEDVALSAALEEIQALGAPKREANGLLAFPYYKDVFFIIMKHARSSFAVEKQGLLKKRREALKSKNMEEYRTIVGDMIQKEEKVGTDFLSEAMESLGLSEQEFMQTHQVYMMNPQTQQILMQAQMAQPSNAGKPTISRQKCKEIFFDSEEKKFESMKSMM